MIVTRLRVRDFRSYASAEAALGERLTIVHGPNGAGKTNLLEALYFGCTGRSCRTASEREVVRFDAAATRVEVAGRDRDGEHELSVGFAPGDAKRVKVDGAPVERLLDAAVRPLVSVFLPDRLELVKGPPALRRSHLDAVVPAVAADLGLLGEAALRYRPRSQAATPEHLAAELAERLDSDLDRGFTGHGPHRDELLLLRDGRELRVYGSQGEQRLALLALLLAERAALEDERGAPPLLLLDDVMSELDAERRERLVQRTRGGGARPR